MQKKKKRKEKMKKGGSIKDSIKGKKKKKCIKIKQAMLRLFLAVLGPPFCVPFGLFCILYQSEGKRLEGRRPQETSPGILPESLINKFHGHLWSTCSVPGTGNSTSYLAPRTELGTQLVLQKCTECLPSFFFSFPPSKLPFIQQRFPEYLLGTKYWGHSGEQKNTPDDLPSWHLQFQVGKMDNKQ